MDLVRTRSVTLGDRLWTDFLAQARHLNMDACQAITSALRQWIALAPDERHCRHCGQVLCETDHHLWWCEDARNVEADGGQGSGAALGSRSDPRARGACDLAARSFLAPAEVQQRG